MQCGQVAEARLPLRREWGVAVVAAQGLRCFLRVGELTVGTCVQCGLMAEASLRLRWERCVVAGAVVADTCWW